MNCLFKQILQWSYKNSLRNISISIRENVSCHYSVSLKLKIGTHRYHQPSHHCTYFDLGYKREYRCRGREREGVNALGKDTGNEGTNEVNWETNEELPWRSGSQDRHWPRYGKIKINSLRKVLNTS